MTVLWKTRLVRLLAAALLLVVVPGASKVVCVSPTGHDTIEDWAEREAQQGMRRERVA